MTVDQLKQREAIKDTVMAALHELNETLEEEDRYAVSQDMALLGGEGVLDSLDFVNLAMILEDLIHERFQQGITLMDEKAFSRKQNPFASVESITSYIEELMKGD